MKKLLMLCSFVMASFITGCAMSPQPPSEPTPTPTPPPTESPMPTPEGELADWNLVWRDEFEGPEINRENWVFDKGGGGWGNNEFEYYTDRPENARIENGMLVIEARQEEYQGSDYTSARMKTQGLHAWMYGRFETRMKLPFGQGIWPAFWMLGEDIPQVGWPRSGEIDIMENIGKEPATVHGTLHGPTYSGANGVGAPYGIDEGQFSDDFHVFAIEWGPEQIQWFVDGNLYQTLTPADVPGVWVYDHPFFLIMNLAVGGGWPGYPDETTTFPQTLTVDYVRIYQKDSYPTPQPRATPTSATQHTMRVTDLSVEVVEVGDSWQASASVTVLDENDEPVEGVTVPAAWSGIVKTDTIEMLTNADGVAGPFLSPQTSETGVIVFCLRPIKKDGYQYDVIKSVDTCASVEH